MCPDGAASRGGAASEAIRARADFISSADSADLQPLERRPNLLLALLVQDRLTPAPTPSPTASPTPTSVGDGAVDLDLPFKTVEKLKEAAALNFSEYDTRAVFIDRYLEALGYTTLGDVQYGFPVDAGMFADYVVRVNDAAAIVIEAKKLGAQLGAKEAAQVVGYCANLGVRWGAVTDGRHFKLYDAPVLGMAPADPARAVCRPRRLQGPRGLRGSHIPRARVDRQEGARGGRWTREASRPGGSPGATDQQ